MRTQILIARLICPTSCSWLACLINKTTWRTSCKRTKAPGSKSSRTTSRTSRSLHQTTRIQVSAFIGRHSMPCKQVHGQIAKTYNTVPRVTTTSTFSTWSQTRKRSQGTTTLNNLNFSVTTGFTVLWLLLSTVASSLTSCQTSDLKISKPSPTSI